MTKRALISFFLLAQLFFSSAQARYLEKAEAGDASGTNRPAAPFQSITYRAVSRGAHATEHAFQNGVARFFKNGILFYERAGGAGGGRGFNIAAINPITGDLIGSVQNFDLWSSRTTGTTMQAMIAYLNSLPNGTLVMIAVADEAGLNQFDSCTLLTFPWVEAGIQALEALGSTQIRTYCYRASYVLLAIKGTGQALEEHVADGAEVSAQTALDIVPPCPTVSSINPTSGQAGSSVIITGTNFSGVNSVRFANNVPAQFTVNSNSQISATVPAGSATGLITIGKPGCSDVQTDSFTVVVPVACPTVNGINPASGQVGSNVIITGANFNGVNSVIFSNNASSSFTVNSATQITVTVPAGAVAGPIAISKTGCEIAQTEVFTVVIPPPCPTVNNINPTSGPAGTSVLIAGSGFTGVSAVRFANNRSAAFTVNSVTQIAATVPVGAVTGPIAISKTGCSDIQTGTFTVLSFIPEGKLLGVNFSPFVDGQDPNLGSQVNKKQLKRRMKIVKPFTEWLGTFGTSNGLDKAGKIAHQQGRKIAVGAWLSADKDANEREILALIRIIQSGEADIAVVGTESILRGDILVTDLIGYINRVKQAAPAIPVTTREVYGVLLSNPDLIAAVDVVFANIYGYWEGIRVDNAVAFLSDKYDQLVAASGGKTVYISETGWPSCGNQVGEAVPSPENARLYFNSFTTWARANNVPYFYFEAFDESWKAKYEGPQGACWGIWDKDGNLKPGVLIR